MKFSFGSGLWPVVQRELRETARRPLNHWLRLGGALGGVVILCTVTADLPFSVVGTELFNYIHMLLLCLICGIVPALTADCISRERREGTMGLLFMTPLTASEIVLGKVLAQVLRALTLWLAVMPLLTIPFLCGGVTWTDVAALLTIELCAAMMCLAAGILASSLTDIRALAFILAFLFMGAFVGEASRYQNLQTMRSATTPTTWSLVAMSRSRSPYYPSSALRMPLRPGTAGPLFRVFPGVSNNTFPGSPGRPFIVTPGPGNSNNFRRAGPRPAPIPLPRPMYGRAVSVPPGFAIMAGPGYFIPATVPIGFASRQPPPSILAQGFFIAAIILLVSIRFAGWCVERSWQDKVPSPRRQGWVKRYCTPMFKNGFARRMRATLEWNPIEWLQQYSWKARLSKWGLCLLFVVLECSVIDGNDLFAFRQVLMGLLLILVAAYTFAGVNGFLEEKKSGALELILVSPTSVKQIISGRIWGLWKQFLPSVLVLVGSNVAFSLMVGQQSFYRGGSWVNIGLRYSMIDLEIGAIYLTLPVVATCFALTAKNLFVASALTVTVVFGPAAILLFPGALFNVLGSFHLRGLFALPLAALGFLAAFPIAIFGVHAYSAMLAYRHLQRNLRRRSYAYS